MWHRALLILTDFPCHFVTLPVVDLTKGPVQFGTEGATALPADRGAVCFIANIKLYLHLLLSSLSLKND